MENNKYNRGKEILLQASLARKGERAGQGKGEGGEKGKERKPIYTLNTTKHAFVSREGPGDLVSTSPAAAHPRWLDGPCKCFFFV